MSKELEERIEKKKQMLRDYLRLSEQWKFKKEDIERMTDMYLDDLNKLMKERWPRLFRAQRKKDDY